MRSLAKKIIYLSIIFIGVELGLRFLGYVPYTPPSPGEAQFIRPDSLKGWAHVPGKFEFAVNTWGDVMHFNINERGERITKAEPLGEEAEEVLLIGGSFTMGIGLDDEETFAWKLQQRFPSVDFRNLAVGAYGTFQSLLALEDELNRETKPKAVIYGFINHHKVRNVSESDWLYSLQAAGEQSEIDLVLPYVTLGEDKALVRHSPLAMVRMPFVKRLATSFMLQRVVNHMIEYKRVKQADEVLEMLLLEMQQLCIKNDISFYVSVLACDSPLMSRLTSFFQQKKISYIDCIVPLNEENTFRDDGHPKAVVNEEWAKRIGERLLQDGIAQYPPGKGAQITNN